MRNSYHFSPAKGWINDPNGTVYVDGEYHLFYQYYPNDIVWGPMHWGHATSRDLMNWQEREIALAPDENGFIFSGSAVIDTDNLSGFGTKEKPAMILMYTNHDPNGNVERQSIAYSTDYVHFTKYEGNPVIDNDPKSDGYKKDFRDPKMFKNEYLGGYSVVFASGSMIEFYHTNDFKNWEKTGEFYPGENGGFDDLCECPDLLEFDCEGEKKYVLTMSCNIDDENKNREHMKFFMQYFVGQFDGKCFVADSDMKERGPLYIDYGPDNYAAVSFSNHKDNVLIGWAENWCYINDIPEKEYRGAMTLPRKVSLVKTKQGLRLSFGVFVTDCHALLKDSFTMKPFDKKSFCDGKIVLETNGNMLTIIRDNTCLKYKSGMLDKAKYQKFSAERVSDGDCGVEIVYDNRLVEIFADGGLLTFTLRID
ncbi:MAG: glycoside hydrolase family 32 protein [Lachnospiraceae bacterium]|nr:glycoside hydrolase family 32 protein [Lachnospiraceae bacterium]